MKRISISQALKQHKTYTTKHGLKIPFKDLQKIQSLNRQYSYYSKATNRPEDRFAKIKTSKLANDYTSSVRRLQTRVNVVKLSRLQNRLNKTKSPKVKSNIKSQITKVKKALSKATKVRFNDDIYKELQNINFDIQKSLNFRDNLMQGIQSNFSLILNEDTYNSIMNELENLTPYQWHSLSQLDGKNIIDFIYLDPSSLFARLDTFLNDLKRVIGRPLTRLSTGEDLEIDYSDIESDFINDPTKITTYRDKSRFNAVFDEFDIEKWTK